jgi:AcrR family transcriptional regulator
VPYRQTPSTQAARARRRAALLGAARQIVATEGFGAASVRAVTAAAGVSPGTLYGYFGTLDELLAQVFRQAAATELAAVRSAVARVPTGAPARLAALVDTFAGRAIRGRRLAWALLAEPVGPLIDAERLAFRRAYADTLARIVADGIDSGELPAQDPQVSGPALVGAIAEALIGPLTPLGAPAATAQDVLTSVRLLCLRAVGARLPSPTHEPGDFP